MNRLRDLPILNSELFFMRPVCIEDAKDMFIYGSDEEVVKYLPWGPYKSMEESVWSIENLFLNRPEKGIPLAYAIVFKANNQMIGTCDFHSVNNEENSGEIGFVLNRNYWNKGIMTQACKLLIDFGFNHLGYDVIKIAHDQRNEASKRVIQKLGFTFLCEKEHQFKATHEKRKMLIYTMKKAVEK